ncbi:MAG: hypothetical protein IMY71_09855 [Bacteroidetes bacterium]|nr:hypothetical protein [Bacteroidota bacterium]
MKFSFIQSININHKKINSKDFYAFFSRLEKIQRERERERELWFRLLWGFLNDAKFWFFVVDGGMLLVTGFWSLVAGCSLKYNK